MAVINIEKSARWRGEIRKAFESFQKDTIDPEVEKRVLKWAKDLMEAAVMYRRINAHAHDFTGNLLNSIVACVYKDGTPLQAFYASDSGQVKAAIHRKMTSPKKYYWRRDYENQESYFEADVETDLGHGFADARMFAGSYRPTRKKGFVIAVAYTTEYAEYLVTTGIENAFMYAHNSGVEYGFKLKGMSVDEFISKGTGLK